MGRLTPACFAGGRESFAGARNAARIARVVAGSVLVVALIAGLSAAISGCGRESASLGKRVIPLGQPVPKGGGRYLVGEPYQVAGVWYQPHEQPDYDRIGKASWYGELFHGRYTANGEIYDMDRLSAAHPTLPLPVYAQVTNLENGRSIVVRVNDRGPYKKDRIIDLSRRSADVLGFRRSGTATVRVRYLRRAPLNGDDSYERQYLASRGYQQFAAKTASSPDTRDPIAAASLPGEPTPPMPDRAERPVAIATRPVPPKAQTPDVVMLDWQTQLKGSPELTGSTGPPAQIQPHRVSPADGPAIQAGSFKNRDNAERARATLSAIAPVDVAQVDVGGEVYFRVRIGPFADEIEAIAALPKVRAAGYDGAKIVMRN